VVISVPIILATIFILIFGLLTFGLGWFPVLAVVAGSGGMGIDLLRASPWAAHNPPPWACA
jgi:hypothetical protein